MNAIATFPYTVGNTESVRASAPALTMGLGPNQLSWLRLNIISFKHAEEQRRQMRQDIVRAARIAGLI